MSRVLITGITGYIGSHLADLLLAEGHEVYGTIRWRSIRDNIRHIENDLGLMECDLRDATSVRRMISEVMPERIFHLSAQSYVPASWNYPWDTLENNIASELNLFEAVRAIGDNYNPPIVPALSSEEYGFVKEDELPITENTPLKPMSPYAVSKVAQDNLALVYHRSYNMNIKRTRFFNSTGPRRGEVFVCSNFAKQLAEIELELRDPVLLVGNLTAQRDFTDGRDIAKAYLLASQYCEAGEVYNIGSGTAYSIEEVLAILTKISGLNDVEVRQVPEKMRPAEVPVLLSDASKFRKATGWKPEIPFEKTLEDLYQYWLDRLRKEK